MKREIHYFSKESSGEGQLKNYSILNKVRAGWKILVIKSERRTLMFDLKFLYNDSM